MLEATAYRYEVMQPKARTLANTGAQAVRIKVSRFSNRISERTTTSCLQVQLNIGWALSTTFMHFKMTFGMSMRHSVVCILQAMHITQYYSTYNVDALLHYDLFKLFLSLRSVVKLVNWYYALHSNHSQFSKRKAEKIPGTQSKWYDVHATDFPIYVTHISIVAYTHLHKWLLLMISIPTHFLSVVANTVLCPQNFICR